MNKRCDPNAFGSTQIQTEGLLACVQKRVEEEDEEAGGEEQDDEELVESGGWKKQKVVEKLRENERSTLERENERKKKRCRWFKIRRAK